MLDTINESFNYFKTVIKKFDIEFKDKDFNEHTLELFDNKNIPFIIQSTQEIDILLRELYMYKNEQINIKQRGIDFFKENLKSEIKSCQYIKISIDRKINCTPWEDIETLHWWDVNNKIKHERIQNKQLCCKHSTLMAMSALAVLIFTLQKRYTAINVKNICEDTKKRYIIEKYNWKELTFMPIV